MDTHNTNIEKIREKLHWYTYEANYEEFNVQEVDYLIKKLKSYDEANEQQIEELCFNSFLPDFSLQKEIQQSKSTSYVNQQKKTSFNITIIIIAIISSLFLIIFPINGTIARNKTNGFYITNHDEKGISFRIFPQIKFETYKSYQDVPNDLWNFIYIPEIYNYELDFIRTKTSTKELETIDQHYKNLTTSDYIIVTYYINEQYKEPNLDLFKQYTYSGIRINCYYKKLNNNIIEYYSNFSYNNNYYSIICTNENDGNITLCSLIDELLLKK